MNENLRMSVSITLLLRSFFPPVSKSSTELEPEHSRMIIGIVTVPVNHTKPCPLGTDTAGQVWRISHHGGDSVAISKTHLAVRGAGCGTGPKLREPAGSPRAVSPARKYTSSLWNRKSSPLVSETAGNGRNMEGFEYLIHVTAALSTTSSPTFPRAAVIKCSAFRKQFIRYEFLSSSPSIRHCEGEPGSEIGLRR